MSKMEITGLEANFLLYCLDRYCKVDKEGNLTEAAWGYDLKDLNDLRWRLFAVHEHPEDAECETFEDIANQIRGAFDDVMEDISQPSFEEKGTITGSGNTAKAIKDDSV
jgi:hypothetical protein